MTPREAFQFGFRMHCAAEGCDETQTRERAQQALTMIKQAAAPWPFSMATGIAEGTAGALKSLVETVAPIVALSPVVAGIGGGYMAARATDNPYDIDEARMNELLAEYQNAIKTMKRKTSDAQPTHLV